MFSFSIEKFKNFYSEEDTDKYQLKSLKKMKARRLSYVNKIVVDLAFQLDLEENNIDYIVYSSRHGELGFSYEIIKSLQNDLPASPTKFSQSVHNSVPGFLTIEKKFNVPVSAIAAGENSFLMGLVSSLSYLNDNQKAKVLYIFSDAKVPLAFQDHLNEPDENVAIAMILRAGSNFKLGLTESNDRDYSKNLQSLDFINWMNKKKESLVLGDRPCWKLGRKD